MRLLHTGDWHLGRAIRQQSRMPEFVTAIDNVVRLAIDERIDAVVIAGDTYDSFAPAPEAEELVFDALRRLIDEGIKIVMIAGNHDQAQRMDAIAGVLRIVGAHCVGRVPAAEGYQAIRVASRDGNDAATFVAVPWIPERLAVEWEHLFGETATALNRYEGQMERALKDYCRAFAPDTANVLVAHVLIDGVTIGEDGSERNLHVGHNFAVRASALPATASYIALGHVHRPQEIVHAAPTYYAGSLLQLDFGEAGQQKSVTLVDVAPRKPAKVRIVSIAGGRNLRTVRTTYDDLAMHRDKYGDDYLRVFVECERPVLYLFDQVREVMANALDVTWVPTGESPASDVTAASHRAVSPEELFTRFYRREHAGAAPPEDLMKLFSELYQSEIEHAPA